MERTSEKLRCKTGARINFHNRTLYEEWRCPCCFHRWYESVDADRPPETCPVCGAILEAFEE